jgi:glycosyltransferase involved in cell wall biosynthesis
MKLIIQIPCLNEEANLAQVISSLPTQIPGIDIIETQVIDDGSTDRTYEIAKKLNVTHVLRNKSNKGLAYSFQSGINNALVQGADIIVNTDGDNQYCGSSIADLVKPIVEGRADIVLGDRKPTENTAFSPLKRMLQGVGSMVVRNLAKVEIDDAVSGFRAYSREAAFGINVMTQFSYTTETLIHAGQQGMTITSVVIKTNKTTRPSRLFKSTRSFISKQAVTILRSYIMYRPLNAFSKLGAMILLLGLFPIFRFLYFFMTGEGEGHVQSLVLGGVLLLAGYMTIVLALLSDTIATNRRLLEQVLNKVRKLEMADSAQQSLQNQAAEIPSRSSVVENNARL